MKKYILLSLIFVYGCAQLETSSLPSCSSSPSCDELIESRLGPDKTPAQKEEYRNYIKSRTAEIIENQFGLKNYTLQCLECNIGRAGFVKAKGVKSDNVPFELYYRWGWCSSGGADCGWSVCFKTPDKDAFSSIKARYCGTIEQRRLHDPYQCTWEAYDNTSEIRQQCDQGKFETMTDDYSFAVIQNANRCMYSVRQAGFDCLGSE